MFFSWFLFKVLKAGCYREIENRKLNVVELFSSYLKECHF